MNTHSTILDNASAEATSSERILQIASAAWRQGNFVEVVDHRWSEYYDQLKSRRYGVAALFTEWIEL
jgi:hypothetical protein